MTSQSTRYFVVPAPGHYGDRARVMYSHTSLIAAKRFAGPSHEVRVGSLRKGDEWLRVYGEIYPIA